MFSITVQLCQIVRSFLHIENLIVILFCGLLHLHVSSKAGLKNFAASNIFCFKHINQTVIQIQAILQSSIKKV